MPPDIVTLRHDRGDHADGALARALQHHVDGDVGFDPGTRALYATDASNYRHVPIGVVIPRTIEALIATVALCREHDAPILARGGGTSLAGQTCNEGVVIDCSRHLTHIEIDREARVARVQPGAIMKELRKAANAVGLEFGPDPSTNDRCTLGGMIGNNSCGVHSVFSEFYGPGPRTSDHVVELDVLTYRGQRVRTRATDAVELRRVRALGDGVGDIYDRIEGLATRYADQIRARFPNMPRRVSGYNLPDLLPEHGHNIARALVGSESTCVLVLDATIALMDAKPCRVVAVLGYPDIFAAAAAANAARELKPIGCEAMDDTLIERIRSRHSGSHKGLGLLPDGKAWLMIEHGADTIGEARAAAERTVRTLGAKSSRLIDDHDEQEALADMREQSLGVDAFAVGKPDNYEGWEDSAVPPARLEHYLRELRRLYDDFDLYGSLYGHFAQGCVHTRIDFGLDSEANVARYRDFTRAAAKLVVAHGGSLSGEHGDGQSRADLHEIMFGPELVTAFDEFKSIWDPDHKMNPGKMVRPDPRTAHLRLVDYHPHPEHIELDHGNDHHDFAHAAVRCVGIGKCRKRDSGAMCPSYMATLDERYSTRGRAHLLFEMMRGDVLTEGWHSEAVKESLDLCLACKACKKECPTQVDMASYKTEFMAHYYDGRLRSREAYVFGWLHRWLALGRPFAPIANALTHLPGLGTLLKRAVGVASAREVPRIASRTFRRTFRPPEAAPGAPRVILWPDTFNDAFYPSILHDAVRVLSRAGYAVTIPKHRLCCGRPLYDFGFVQQARRLWERTLDELAPDIAAGVPIVGLEPSCVSSFRDELPALFPDDERAAKLSDQTRTLGELLAESSNVAHAESGKHLLYHRHCHQAAVLSPEREVEVLRAAGHRVDVLDSGCCGMAGAFGFQRDKYELSVALAERVLLPALRASPDATLVTDGFSCREQVRQLAGVRPLHVAEILAAGELARTR
ncbi:MAG TPA: FAD-binding and (Fe-S)-binding domain-containing protein [Kofleriaceae bacterium]|jgi:FAD/FMN-containing dehydrogenase/Fe-S oxidoreductase